MVPSLGNPDGLAVVLAGAHQEVVVVGVPILADVPYLFRSEGLILRKERMDETIVVVALLSGLQIFRTMVGEAGTTPVIPRINDADHVANAGLLSRVCAHALFEHNSRTINGTLNE